MLLSKADECSFGDFSVLSPSKILRHNNQRGMDVASPQYVYTCVLSALWRMRRVAEVGICYICCLERVAVPWRREKKSDRESVGKK